MALTSYCLFTREWRCLQKSINRSFPTYIDIIADKIQLGLSPNIEVKDLKSEGVFGAIEAIKTFNPKKARFVTHLDRRVRGRILDYIRREDWVTRHIRLRHNQLLKAKCKLKDESGYEPTEEQFLEELSKDTYPADPGYSKNPRMKIKGEEKAKLIIKDAKNLKTRSYSFPLNNMGKEEKESGDVEFKRCLKDKKAPNSLYETQKKDLKELLIRGLTRAEKLVVVLYYCENMTQKEIGKTLGLEESRISQIHSALLLRLKSKLTARGLTLEDCLNNL